MSLTTSLGYKTLNYKILKTPYIFRYISDNELNFIKNHHVIYSYNPRGIIGLRF